MAPSHWHKAIIIICLKPVQKTLTQVVENLEDVKVLDATGKKSENQKSDKR